MRQAARPGIEDIVLRSRLRETQLLNPRRPHTVAGEESGHAGSGEGRFRVQIHDGEHGGGRAPVPEGLQAAQAQLDGRNSRGGAPR